MPQETAQSLSLEALIEVHAGDYTWTLRSENVGHPALTSVGIFLTSVGIYLAYCLCML